MKRILFITLFFALAFSVLCITSCNFDNDVETQVSKQACAGPFCYRPSGEVETISGCHNKGNCVDCYWYPCTFGCYSNDCTNMEYWSDCAVPSFVIFGFDFTLLECYGDDGIRGTDRERRDVRVAQEGIDYRIDSIKVVVNDDINNLKEFTSGNLGFSEIDDFLVEIIALINLKEATKVEFFIEYTALVELNKAEFGVDVIYDHEMMNFSNGAYAKAGNVINIGDGNYKSQNIPEGKHFLHAVVSFDVYELLQFEGFSDMKFIAYAYEEE